MEIVQGNSLELRIQGIRNNCYDPIILTLAFDNNDNT